MTLIALTDCCQRLAVDRKTLHRWLAQAELCLQAHPADARCKGLSGEHLLALARAHHRSLTGLPPDPPAPAAPASSELSTEGLAWLHMLSTLPAQITALEERLAQLTALLEERPQPSVTLAPGQQPSSPGKHRPTPKAKAPRATTSSAPQPVASAHVIARVEYVREGHYVVLCPKAGVLALEPDTSEWFAWLATQSSFRFVGQQGHFSAHHAWRLKTGAWRAHRHIRNHSYTLRLAPTHELTIAVLEQAAEALQAHLR